MSPACAITDVLRTGRSAATDHDGTRRFGVVVGGDRHAGRGRTTDERADERTDDELTPSRWRRTVRADGPDGPDGPGGTGGMGTVGRGGTGPVAHGGSGGDDGGGGGLGAARRGPRRDGFGVLSGGGGGDRSGVPRWGPFRNRRSRGRPRSRGFSVVSDNACRTSTGFHNYLSDH